MTSDRHELMCDIFHSALALSPDQRAEFLHRACAGDEALRCEVESLLSLESQAANFIEKPAVRDAAEILGEDRSRLIGEIKSCPKCGHSYPSVQRYCPDDNHPLSFPDPYHLVGRTIVGKYRLEALIGIGGMGVVYSAHHLLINRRVAFKILQPNIAISNKQAVRLFEREAKVVGRLVHENIADIKDAGRADDNIAYLVIEWLDGHTLAEIISSRLLGLVRASKILRQICAALEAAHRNHIIHRDLKPSNIMLTRQLDGSEQVKVLDFGIAKVIDEATDASVSAVMGTPHYASPEQLRTGAYIDERSDIYSLGVVLYQMLTKSLPYQGVSLYELLRMQKEVPPVAIRKLRPEIPGEVEWLIGRMLAEDPEDRPQQVVEVADIFERAIGPSSASEGIEHSGFRFRPAGGAPTDPNKSEAELGDKPVQTFSHAPHLVDPEIVVTGPTALKHEGGRSGGGWGSVAVLTASVNRLLGPVRSFKPAVFGVCILLIVLAGVAARLFNSYDGSIDTLAILPFVNTGTDANLEYISDGITESLIQNLSQVSSLKITQRDSVFHYKGRQTNLNEVGRELNVRTVVTGRITQVGENLSVSVSLTDTQNNHLLWEKLLSYKADDILHIPIDMALDISEHLRLGLSGDDRKRMANLQTTNHEAYRLYLQGRYFSSKGTEKDLRESIKCYKEAVSKDRAYALAYAALSSSYITLGSNFGPPKAMFEQASQYKSKALEYGDRLADAHFAVAEIEYLHDWNWEAAEWQIKRTLELNPNHARALCLYSELLQTGGRMDEAILKSKQALLLNPLSRSAHINLGLAYYFARQADHAGESFRNIIALDPGVAYQGVALSQDLKGEYEDAVRTLLSKVLPESPDNPSALVLLGRAYSRIGKAGEAKKISDKIELVAKQRYVLPYEFAILQTALGDYNKAFQFLDQAFKERSPYLLHLNHDPLFDDLRSDKRYQNLLQRIGVLQ